MNCTKYCERWVRENFALRRSSPPLLQRPVIVSLDASSWTLGSARPAQQSLTLDHRCFARVVIKRCTNFGGAVVSVLRADTELLERCQALFKQRSIAVMNFSLALVWSCLCGSNARFRSLSLRQRYSNAGFSGAPLKQRSCFPPFCARWRALFPSPYHSRNATTTFVRWDLGLRYMTFLMDYEGYTLYFYQENKQVFFIKMWYIFCFYFSTVEKSFLNACYLYLLKLNKREVILHLITLLHLK